MNNFQVKQMLVSVAEGIGMPTSYTEAVEQGKNNYIILEEKGRGKMFISMAHIETKSFSRALDHPMIKSHLTPDEMYHYLAGIVQGLNISKEMQEAK